MNNALPIIHHALYRPSPVGPSAHPAKSASFTQAYWDAATDKAGKHKIVGMAYARYSPYGVRFDVGLPEALYVPIGGDLDDKDVWSSMSSTRWRTGSRTRRLSPCGSGARRRWQVPARLPSRALGCIRPSRTLRAGFHENNE